MIRLRLLLDTMVEAANGLRRELALPASSGLPADGVPTVEPGVGLGGLPDRPRAAVRRPDPAAAAARAAARAPDRRRLQRVEGGVAVRARSSSSGLGWSPGWPGWCRGRASRRPSSSTERTCCIRPSCRRRGRCGCASARPASSPTTSSGRLVNVEPSGRPVVVVSTDREVAESVTKLGARSVSSSRAGRRDRSVAVRSAEIGRPCHRDRSEPKPVAENVGGPS